MGSIVAASAGQAGRSGAPPRALLLALVAVVAAVVLAALSGCTWLDTRQRQIALRPTPGLPADFGPGSAAEQANFKPGDQRFLVTVPAADGTPGHVEQLALWWLPHASPAAPTLLYLHGTFRSLYGNLSKINALRAAGFAIVAVDYRGWGESTAIVPSESTITADALVAWAELQRRQPQPRQRVVFGHSLGGAVAVRLASGLHGSLHAQPDYGALVLESTFTRLPDVAAAAGFWGGVGASLTTLEFDSLTRIGRIDAPLLMLHGALDKTVPVELGRRLRDAAPPGVRWVEVPEGTHSRLHEEAPEVYRRAFKDLQDTLAHP